MCFCAKNNQKTTTTTTKNKNNNKKNNKNKNNNNNNNNNNKSNNKYSNTTTLLHLVHLIQLYLLPHLHFLNFLLLLLLRLSLLLPLSLQRLEAKKHLLKPQVTAPIKGGCSWKFSQISRFAGKRSAKWACPRKFLKKNAFLKRTKKPKETVYENLRHHHESMTIMPSKNHDSQLKNPISLGFFLSATSRKHTIPWPTSLRENCAEEPPWPPKLQKE